MTDKRKICLIRPVISEKNTDLEILHKYVFDVIEEANSRWVKEDVEQMFKVKVEDVNLHHLPAKKKRVRMFFKSKGAVKRAIVTLEKGQKIDILEQQR